MYSQHTSADAPLYIWDTIFLFVRMCDSSLQIYFPIKQYICTLFPYFLPFWHP